MPESIFVIVGHKFGLTDDGARQQQEPNQVGQRIQVTVFSWLQEIMSYPYCDFTG